MDIRFSHHAPACWGLPLLAIFGLAASACESQATTGPGPHAITVQLENAQGQAVASAAIMEGLAPSIASSARVASGARQSPPAAGGVTVAIQVTDLPPGTHGFHVHSVGRCAPPDFTSAGPNLNPDSRSHGVRSPNGPQAGDLPNLTVDSDHTAFAAFFVEHLSMSQLESAPNGTALVIDGAPDDDLTDPSGGSGAHIACGVITTAPAPSPTPSPTPTSTVPAPPTPAATPTPAAGTASQTKDVILAGLAPGTYPVHLHSRCDGRQGFHIRGLDNLAVNRQGQGSVPVPNADFGRGWCVIVYTNASLQNVLATRMI
jgi:Cu-Zn family superoxide dismutase